MLQAPSSVLFSGWELTGFYLFIPFQLHLSNKIVCGANTTNITSERTQKNDTFRMRQRELLVPDTKGTWIGHIKHLWSCSSKTSFILAFSFMCFGKRTSLPFLGLFANVTPLLLLHCRPQSQGQGMESAFPAGLGVEEMELLVWIASLP